MKMDFLKKKILPCFTGSLSASLLGEGFEETAGWVGGEAQELKCVKAWRVFPVGRRRFAAVISSGLWEGFLESRNWRSLAGAPRAKSSLSPAGSRGLGPG